MSLSRIEHIKNLLITHQRSLHILREQEAKFGLNVPTHIKIEIEDIEAEMVKLQHELTQLKAPLVYIHNFGERQEPPSEAIELAWNSYFAFGEPYRTVPSPESWQRELLPALEQLRQKMGQRGLVRLRTTGALSVGFAFGYTFREVGQYKLEVAQFPPHPPPFWYSDEGPPEGKAAPRFTVRRIVGNPQARDMVVIVYATPGRSPESVCQAVAAYLGVGDGLAGLFSEQSPTKLEGYKGVLLLESGAAAEEERFIEGWEAAALARGSRRPVIDFSSQVAAERLHLFLAAPFGLAVFLGHHWNAIGRRVQCYEWIGGSRYAPACLLNMS